METAVPEKLLLAELLNARMRPTTARIAVLELLERSPAPLHADEVFRHLGSEGGGLALGTVYRALRDLADGRLVQRDWHEEPCGSRKASYRLRRACDARHGVELVCMACGRAVHLPDAGLHRQLAQAAAAGGMALAHSPLVLRLEQCGCVAADADRTPAPPCGGGTEN
jgi:Fe2+ or Zn2+ uptake regulation protein